MEFSGGLVGLEELAARLGSIVPSHLQGNVILAEDFENGITEWVPETENVGSAVASSTTRHYAGAKSMSLYSVTGDSGFAQASRLLHYPGETKVAIFARVLLKDDSDTVYLGFLAYNGVTEVTARLVYDRYNSTLAVLTTGPTTTTVKTGLTLGPVDYTWYPVTLIIDLSTGKYVKAILGQTEVDLSAYSLYSSTIADALNAIVLVAALSLNGYTFTVYVDDVVVLRGVP